MLIEESYLILIQLYILLFLSFILGHSAGTFHFAWSIPQPILQLLYLKLGTKALRLTLEVTTQVNGLAFLTLRP